MLAQRRAVDESRARIAAGEHPVFHVVTTWDGSAVDVRIVELPLVHVFVPDASRVADGARTLIARTLGVEPGSFSVAVAGGT
jgi:hypothetical protein